MFRKLICFASVIVVLALSSSVWAVAYTWDDGNSVDHYWGSPNNWDPNGVPVFGDDILIGSGFPEANQPVIPAGTDANAGSNADSFAIIGTLDDASLTVESGGSLTILPSPDDGSSPILMLGSGWVDGGNGILNVAGDVNTRRVWVGYNSQAVTNGSGWINMTGGTFIASIAGGGQGGFEIARGDDCMGTVTPGNGYVHLDGGVIDVQGFFTMRRGYPACGLDPSEEWPTSNGYMDVTGGTMMLQYDVRDTIQHYIDEGWITAYGIGSMEDATIVSDPRAEIVMDYDWRNTEKTTITAYKPANNGEPYKLYPPQYAVDVDPTVTLHWTPGDYLGTGGTPGSKAGNGHHVFIGTLEAQSGNMAGWNLQYPVGTQFGHIVGAQDANTFSVADCNELGNTLALNTEYVWTVIEANDANGIPGGGATRDISWWKPQVVYHFRTVGGAPANPSPGNGSTVGIKVGAAALNVELSWDRGYYAASTNGHQIYFGTDFNDVNEANTLDPAFVQAQDANTYTATGLKLGQEYFWRVDEVNTAGPDPCIWPGTTWSFTVGDYRVIDDFDYATLDDMNDFWKINGIDYTLSCSYYGGGASLDLAGGAMSYSYDNNDIIGEYGPLGLDFFSEVRYEFASPVDFTEGDSETTMRALALDYAGSADNAADPNYDRMYVALEDNNSPDGNMAIVFNPDASAQKKPSGQLNIDLRDFSDAGVDIHHVVYLYLGFGIQCNPNPGTPGEEGLVSFDNIRVYPPRCVGQPGGVPYYGQLGDLNGDCTVDIKDMKMLSNHWLKTDRITGMPVPVADDDPCMMARWEFEGNWNNDPNARIKADSNGIAHGTPQFVVDETRPQSQAGNQVAYFDQVDVNDYVICGTWGQDGNFLGKSFTLMAWRKQTEPNGWADMLSKGEASVKLEMGMTPWLERQVHFVATASGNSPDKKLDLNRWYHVAGTYEKLPDVNGGISRVYIDGHLEGVEDINDEAYLFSHNPNYDPNWCIGAQDYEGAEGDTPPYRPHIDRLYYGYLDDVRVYDRQLSEEEIMWLAGKTAKNYYPILPPAAYADIYSPDPKGQKIINFKDMAKFAQEWLESALWPVIP